MCPLVNFAPASNDQAFSMPPPDFFMTILYYTNTMPKTPSTTQTRAKILQRNTFSFQTVSLLVKPASIGSSIGQGTHDNPNSQDEAQEFAGTRPGNCDPLVRWTLGLAWTDGFRGALLGSSGGPERLRWSEVKMGYNMV